MSDPTQGAALKRTDRRILIGVLSAVGAVVVVIAVVAALTLGGGRGDAVPGAGSSPSAPSSEGALTGQESADQAPTDPATPSAEPTPTSTPSTAPLTARSAATTAGGAVSDRVDSGWVERVSERVGIPRRALAAYAGAALETAERDPGCNLSWNTLAGIGYVESKHGTLTGGSIGADGITRPSIIGIALDGSQTRTIPDSDNGRLDGDSEWDRAVGPMQFIPQSWESFGEDGSGDGVADPQNIDDAALSAAAYLCETGGDLSQVNNWITAVAAYNDATDYNASVVAAADHYATTAGN